MDKTFKAFLEEEEKQEKGHPFLSALEDELGIEPGDLENEPQIASFFSLGGVSQNLGPYKILHFYKNDKGEITHALVKNVGIEGFKNKRYVDKDNKISRTDTKVPEGEKFIVGIDELDSLLSQGFQPPSMPAGGVI